MIEAQSLFSGMLVVEVGDSRRELYYTAYNMITLRQSSCGCVGQQTVRQSALQIR